MNTIESNKFELVQESAHLGFHERLVELGRISMDILGSRRPSSARSTANVTAEEMLTSDEIIDLNVYLSYFDSLTFEDLPARFVLVIEGVDENLYLLQIAASAGGFKLFAGSVSVSWFRDLNDEVLPQPHYNPTADFTEQFTLADHSVTQAYLVGIRRIASWIWQTQVNIIQPQLGSEADSNRLPEGSRNALSDDDSKPPVRLDRLGTIFSLRHSSLALNFATTDAGFFAYAVGILGAAGMLASEIGPGWLGFIVAFVPASLVATWAVVPHA